MSNELVHYSRRGDIFHYRWAARRCIKLINPSTTLQKIVIEGSDENTKIGEYVIDVAEYYSDHTDDYSEIIYSQLKHSSVNIDIPFTISKFKVTFYGFALRYKDLLSGRKFASKSISFKIVTNRRIAPDIKTAIEKIKNGQKAERRITSKLEEYTQLNPEELRDFLARLELVDFEGDYIDQRYYLACDIAAVSVSTPDSTQIASIIELVQEKAASDDGTIVPGDVLKRFGVVSVEDLFPAPLKKLTIIM